MELLIVSMESTTSWKADILYQKQAVSFPTKDFFVVERGLLGQDTYLLGCRTDATSDALTVFELNLKGLLGDYPYLEIGKKLIVASRGLSFSSASHLGVQLVVNETANLKFHLLA